MTSMLKIQLYSCCLFHFSVIFAFTSLALHIGNCDDLLIQVMVLCRKVTHHYLIKCWPINCMSPFGVNRTKCPQCITMINLSISITLNITNFHSTDMLLVDAPPQGKQFHATMRFTTSCQCRDKHKDITLLMYKLHKLYLAITFHKSLCSKNTDLNQLVKLRIQALSCIWSPQLYYMGVTINAAVPKESFFYIFHPRCMHGVGIGYRIIIFSLFFQTPLDLDHWRCECCEIYVGYLISRVVFSTKVSLESGWYKLWYLCNYTENISPKSERTFTNKICIPSHSLTCRFIKSKCSYNLHVCA